MMERSTGRRVGRPLRHLQRFSSSVRRRGSALYARGLCEVAGRGVRKKPSVAERDYPACQCARRPAPRRPHRQRLLRSPAATRRARDRYRRARPRAAQDYRGSWRNPGVSCPRAARGAQAPAVQYLRFVVAALGPKHVGQGVQGAGDAGMVPGERILFDCERAPVQRLRLDVAAAGIVHDGQIVDRRSQVEVVLAKSCLVDRDRSLEELLCFLVAASFLIYPGQVVKGESNLGVVASQRCYFDVSARL